VKTRSRVKLIPYAIVITTTVTAVLGQDIETRKSIDSTDFYLWSEGGVQYIPSIKINDFSVPFSTPLEGSLQGEVTGTQSISNYVVNPSAGYNFILGFGYQINSNLGVELEVGYAQNSLGSASFTSNSSANVLGTSAGTPFSGTAEGEGTGSFSSTSGTLTYIPILINLCVQERSARFQPTVSFGLGACPTIFNCNNITYSYSESGTINGTISGAGFSAPYTLNGSFSGEGGGSSTAVPFAFKGKAGFDYIFTPHASLGLRAWAMGLANSDFGGQLKSDLYGAIGLNATFKIRF